MSAPIGATLLRCPRCTRNNPGVALFCYFDGAALGDPARPQAATDPARKRFPMPFIFPSGKVCHTFDELALAIQTGWAEARDLLRQGVFGGFFAGLGRGDLVLAAREASRLSDSDRALDNLLRALPSGVLETPRLAVEPAKVNLGTLSPGQNVRFDLHVSNSGMGLLTGAVSCEDAPWLVLGDGDARARKKIFQTLHEVIIPVHLGGPSLAAGNKPLVARLVIDSNGGQTQVPITVEVPVTPFREGVLAGATTPRQIAQKARDNPKEAAELFARGAVERWYQSNGWTYPVQEPSASGLAAVQQFFEALGLTTPPRVNVNTDPIQLAGRGGDIVRTTVQIVAQEKKPVFAHATSDQPWLTVNEIVLDGRTATVHLRVPDVPDRPGETLSASVSIISNGRQRFRVPVLLTITGPSPVGYRNQTATPPPVTADIRHRDQAPPVRRVQEIEEVLPVVERLEEAAPVRRRDPDRRPRPVFDAEPTDGAGRYALAALPVVFILFGLLATFIRDVGAWLRRPGEVIASSQDFADLPQDLFVHFHDQEEGVSLSSNGGVKPTDGRQVADSRPAIWEPSMRFGLDLAGRGGFGPPKRLTFEQRGLTNNTVIRLDGAEWLFGERPFRSPNGRYLGPNWPGRWLDRNAQPDRPLKDGRRSVWLYDEQQVQVTQTVGLVPGAQSGKIDTCLVHYRIDNKSAHSHSVGLRFLLDTYIGGNDGVPFLIPGSPRLCNTQRELVGSQVPDFIQARESEDLNHPGTIALIQLKIPGQEPPSRVTLGAWPNPELGGLCRQEKTLWHVPMHSMKSLTPGDSAVVLYWDDIQLPPGRRREMAFAYGLGRVIAGEAGGNLGLSIAGSFTPGGEFTLTAEVRNPIDGQTVRVELPEGFTLAAGRPTEVVPALAANAPARISPVTWRIKAAPREGNFTLRVRSSSGVSQTVPVRIKVRGIFGN